MSTTKGYDVFVNGTFKGFVIGQNKKARTEAVRSLVKSTHMGSWHNTAQGIEYATSIGVYILFQPCKRVSAMLGNYRIEAVIKKARGDQNENN